MAKNYPDLDPAPRLLLGPGPSMVPPRVLRAMATPLLGHLDPDFHQILTETQELLRDVFQSRNELTLALSGTGTSGMEAALGNLIEPGDRLLACVAGYFGERLAEVAARYGAEVRRLERPWGEVFEPDEVEAALRARDAKIVTLVHAETSTGTLQPEIAAIAEACHRHGALLVLDTVTSLGGLPVEADSWDVDIAYSASQKCLSAPPGLAPITVSERARQAISRRKAPPAALYFDLTLLERHWGKAFAYHHTIPISTVYALREALRLVQEEGLPARFERHRLNGERLWAGLEALDLPPRLPPGRRMPLLTTVSVPAGVDDAALRRRLLHEYHIEIGGAFGQFAGKVWRIGLMGYSSRKENVLLVLAALEEALH
jgi:alanine-glyoxylate transaminase/serine-glyoxylate transaminase/serine-pyruvate transaminase